ncbi:MAG TPA: hypothetical protein VNU84_07070 [Candidatus Acidoferrum sp.]|nr:hypothetical protein [Candidatus Acidoferrum sp.]
MISPRIFSPDPILESAPEEFAENDGEKEGVASETGAAARGAGAGGGATGIGAGVGATGVAATVGATTAGVVSGLLVSGLGETGAGV